MRLIQYRFTSGDLTSASCVGEFVQKFFERSHDLDLRAVYVVKGDLDKLAIKALTINQVREAVAASLLQSFSDVVDYSEHVSIKSNISCRFVVFEDDGLLRICHAHDDEPIDFAGLQCTSEDVSELLIETDLFD